MARRHTVRSVVRINELTEELCIGAAIRMRTDADAIRPVVAAVVQYLIDEYPSQDLYIPGGVAYPLAEIQRDLAQGESVRSICRRYRIGRQTLYRLVGEPGASDSPRSDAPTCGTVPATESTGAA